MTVLLVSPFIDPQAVGEPRWCYDLARAITDRTEAVIVTQSPRKRDFRVADLFPGTRVYEHSPWELDLLPRRVHALIKPNYLLFHRQARRAIERELDRRAIRCAHHFGPLALRYPTPLRGAGIPYIIGPLGGSLPTPPAFDAGEGGQPWYYRLRDFDGLRFRHDPWLRASYANAACLVGVADYVRDILAPVPLRDFACCPEIAAPSPPTDIDVVQAKRRAHSRPLRFLIVSRLIFSKGVQFALRAAARLGRTVDWRIDVLGEGPMRAELEGIAVRLGVADRVTLHGHVPRSRVDDFYREADVFLFPSIREPSGAVVFEAMSWGLPMIGADYGGPAAHIRDEFGVRVGVGSEEGYVNGLAEAMGILAASPDRRSAMGDEAVRAAVGRHSMDAMADFFLSLYERHGRPKDSGSAGLYCPPADV